MHITKSLCRFVLLTLLVASPVAAETIRMKSGGKFVGTIVRQDDQVVVIDIPGWRQETLRRSDIESIAPDQLSTPPPDQTASTALPSAPAPSSTPASGTRSETPYFERHHRDIDIHFTLDDGGEVIGRVIDEDAQTITVRQGDRQLVTFRRDSLLGIGSVPGQVTKEPPIQPSWQQQDSETSPPSAEWQRLTKQSERTGKPPTREEIRQTPEWKALDKKYRGPDGRFRRDMAGNWIELHTWSSGLSSDELDQISSLPDGRDPLTEVERQFGADSSQMSDQLHVRAQMYRERGDHAKAEPLLKRLVAVTEKQYGSDDPIVAERLDEYAETLQNLGKAREATMARSRAQAIRANAPSEEEMQARNADRVIHDVKNELAREEAEHGPDSYQAATTMELLADLLAKQGRYAEAEPLLKRAIDIHEQRLNMETPLVPLENKKRYLRRTLVKYGQMLRSAGRKQEADRLSERISSLGD